MHIEGLLEDKLPIPESKSFAEYVEVAEKYVLSKLFKCKPQPSPTCSKPHRASLLLHQENGKRGYPPRSAQFPGSRDPEHRRTGSHLDMMRYSGHLYALILM
jgi:hypothetical protein